MAPGFLNVMQEKKNGGFPFSVVLGLIKYVEQRHKASHHIFASDTTDLHTTDPNTQLLGRAFPSSFPDFCTGRNPWNLFPQFLAEPRKTTSVPRFSTAQHDCVLPA